MLINVDSCSLIYHTQNTPRRVDATHSFGIDVDKPSAHGAFLVMGTQEKRSRPRSNKSPEYNAWCHMRQRCLNPAHHAYKDYGGRGISVCDRWAQYENFLSDMGMRLSPKHSLDRIDNNGNYEPGNCRWATASQQVSNRRPRVLITVGDETLTPNEWSLRHGVPKRLILIRLWHGWSAEKAVSTPKQNPLDNLISYRPKNTKS